MVYELRRQPFRGIYIAYQTLLTTFVRQPIWFLSSLFFRPRASWSRQKTRLLPFFRLWSEFGSVATRVGSMREWPDYRAIPDVPGVKSVWIEAVPHLVLGDVKKWAEAADVHAVRIPGYWLDKEGHDTPLGAPPAADEKVVLYIHGGGLISQSAHPHDMMAKVPLSVLGRCPAAKRALSVEYRLTDLRPPANPFPAALIDCIAAYHYLVATLGFPPSSIVVLGDSAGGCLALALARYLIAHAAELSRHIPNFPASPPEYSMILLSPWCDLGSSHETPGSSLLDFTYDFLPDPRSGLLYAVRQVYAAALGPAALETNAYISPASRHPENTASFKGFPRTFIDVGDAERLLDMCRTLRDMMVRDMGADMVRYGEGKDAVHDYIHNATEVPQAEQMLKAIEAWME